MTTTDTIAAIATPPGTGGIGVIRVSGQSVRTIVSTLFGSVPAPHCATLKQFRNADGAVLDQGLVLFFAAPDSYTGEDVLELQGHGGPVVLDLVLSRVLELGARLAEPGEFTRRAFINSKMDLAQAEAVADLIASGSEAAARAAQRSLSGEFSARIETLLEQLIELRTYVEAALDFADEDIDFLADEQIARRNRALAEALAATIAMAEQGVLLKDGIKVVILGRPNAGKSSLINRLAGFDKAIVTDIPGTTRDLLSEHINLNGMPLKLVDTAGLQETGDVVEREGIRRALRETEHADRILLVIDAAADADDPTDLLSVLPQDVPITRVYNKIDLTGATPGRIEGDDAIAISARHGAGIDALRDHLQQAVGFAPEGETLFTARRRHLVALHDAHDHIVASTQLMHGGADAALFAEELRLAQESLGQITGVFTSDDLLGRIFSTFCIGK